MVVQHNITAMNANRYFGINNSKLSKSLEKLSSGYAINRAGDNAAGLAVSEKMRSQIAGMTQGVKNAQDGISMIQTFEGALTETDSILQRMKTLADQAANGTYQDDVDREAIQLEFDQLNDELNQIADTDFNGVILLNGGQMADGTLAVDGKFDYANNFRSAKQLGASDIKLLDSQKVDTKNYADTDWGNIFADVNRGDNKLENDGPESFEVTFKYDATKGEWSAVDATNGAKLDVVKGLVDNKAGNGGFKFGTSGNLANVVVDESDLVNGDTITLKITNPKNKTTAPENGGATVKTNTTTAGSAADALKADDADLEVTVTGITNDDMTKDIKDLLDKLSKATVTAKYDATSKDDSLELSIDGVKVSKAAGITVNGKKFEVDDDTAGQIVITVGSGSITLKMAPDGAATDGLSGNITYGINFSDYDYTEGSKPTAEIVENSSQVSKSNSNNYATAPLTYTDHLVLQAGARTKDSVDFTFRYSSNGLGDLKANMDCSARADGLGTADLSLLDQKSANYAIDKIDNAINKVSMVRATFGSVQNRLEHKIDNMNVTIENLTSAESRIRDTNMADEMMNFTKNQILSQASQSMLAQANSLPQSVLQLLQ